MVVVIENAPSEEEKETIKGIRDVTFDKPASYCEGLKRALKGEQNAVREYRRILYALQDRVQINILTGIITDEIRHGILYNYLFSGNGCRA